MARARARAMAVVKVSHGTQERGEGTPMTTRALPYRCLLIGVKPANADSTVLCAVSLGHARQCTPRLTEPYRPAKVCPRSPQFVLPSPCKYLVL